jgi:adenosinetriphosphatase
VRTIEKTEGKMKQRKIAKKKCKEIADRMYTGNFKERCMYQSAAAMRQILGNDILYVKRGKKYRKMDGEYLETLFEGKCMPGKNGLEKVTFRWNVYIKSKSKKNYIVLDEMVLYKIQQYIRRQVQAKNMPEYIPEEEKKSYANRVADYIALRERDSFFSHTGNKEYLSILSVNRNYENFNTVKTRKMINDNIPDDYTLLYPKARAKKRCFILHVGQTNTGKTYEAVQDMMQSESGIYLAPLRLLALETQERLLDNGVECSMLTGEEEDIHYGSSHMSSTVEMLDTTVQYDVCVIDEAQMIADTQRGWAWTRAIIGCLAERIHVCMSEDALQIVKRIIERCGDSYTVVEHKRNTPLVFEDTRFEYPVSIRKHDALITFSRRSVLQTAAELEEKGYRPSVIYGALPYSVRREEMRKFNYGETDIIIATDAIGMGINLPIERIIFLQDTKYDGKTRRSLNVQEVKQIAGRAGRKGIYDTGYVNSLYNERHINKLLNTPYEKIKKACIQVPETLLTLDIPLSVILEKWIQVKEDGIFFKRDCKDAYKKAVYLETYCKNMTKEEMWSLICIPVDSEDSIYSVWKNLCSVHYENRDIRDMLSYDITPGNRLDILEHNYKVLDLYYAFAKRTDRNKDDNEFMEMIAREKEQCSMDIIEVLKNNKKENLKRCTSCGKILPAIYPYRKCEKCHEKETSMRMIEQFVEENLYDDFIFF